jgi:hypothetical protein
VGSRAASASTGADEPPGAAEVQLRSEGVHSKAASTNKPDAEYRARNDMTERRNPAVAGDRAMRLDREPPTARERGRGPESSHSGPLGAESRGAIAAVSLVAYPERLVQPSRLSAGHGGLLPIDHLWTTRLPPGLLPLSPLRSRPALLLARLCPHRPPHHPARCQSPLPAHPPRTPAARRPPGALPGPPTPDAKSDASDYPSPPALPHRRPGTRAAGHPDPRHTLP